MKLALITLSKEGASVADRLARGLPGADVFLHDSVGEASSATQFSSIVDLTKEIFGRYRGLVYIAPCGVVVRAVASNLQHKTTDPAVVVVDVGSRYAISLLSGHEGGANELAVLVGNILGAEPVVTTTTEALKTLIVGVGCRRGVKAEAIVEAVHKAVEQAGGTMEQVRLLATADIKGDEPGLREAALRLGIPLRLIASEEIRMCQKEFRRSDLVRRKVNLPAVAEPAALLAGRRTSLALAKIVHGAVTVAVAREDCSW